MTRDRARQDDDASEAPVIQRRVSPGKTARTDALPTVQRKGDDASDTDVQARAAEGVGGAGERLPFMDAIQKSFGPHDVSGMRAHTGAAATSAASDIGAVAYATGNDIAFGASPDLHTAAHEAAHVVQQRAGVHLKGGVGAQGDTHEQHADAVADRVVAGESAVDLLGAYAGGGGGGGGAVTQRAVQLIKKRDTDGEESVADFATRVVEKANQVVLETRGGRTNQDYIRELLVGVADAKKSGHMLETVCNALCEAIDKKTFKPAPEPEIVRYSIDDVEGLDQLSGDERGKVVERIASKNSGEDGFHCHRGVGGQVTMDLAGLFGGKGRGDARLQFLANGTMRIVSHDNSRIV